MSCCFTTTASRNRGRSGSVVGRGRGHAHAGGRFGGFLGVGLLGVGFFFGIVCNLLEARVAALAAETDPAAGLAERDALVRLVGNTTAGVTVEAYAAWWAALVRTLNVETKRLFPDWRARPGLLLNPWPYALDRP